MKTGARRVNNLAGKELDPTATTSPTLPVVLWTGGLRRTIIGANQSPELNPMRFFFVSLSLVLASPVLADDSIGSSDVADAASSIAKRRVHMTGEIRSLTSRPVHGPAITVRAVRDANASEAATGIALIKLLESAAQGSVVVVTIEGNTDYAVFGASFAALGLARKLGGFIVDGAVRDLASIRKLDFPVFARGVTPGSAGGRFSIASVNETIDCGGISVSPGDLIVADEDGVTVVPKDLMSIVLPKAHALHKDEQDLLRSISEQGSYFRAVRKER